MSEEGYDDDIVIQFNLANDTVEPLTWEAEDDFHYQFWGAIRSYLERVESSDELRAEFNSDRFQVESMDTGDILTQNMTLPKTDHGLESMCGMHL